MTSQEVIDFVAERLAKDMPIQKICEEVCLVWLRETDEWLLQMCAHCLSPSTAGDGTGCDNMTVIITKLSLTK
jgi:protein phosphatase 1G